MRIKEDHRLKIVLLVAGDAVFLYVALLAALYLRYQNPSWGLLDHITPFTFIFTLWIFLFGAFGIYDFRIMKNSKFFLYRLIRVVTVNTVLTIFLLYLIPLARIEPRRNLILIAAVSTIFIFLWRSLFNRMLIRSPSSRVLFFGANREAVELTEYLRANPQLGLKSVGFLVTEAEPAGLPLPCFFVTGENLTQILSDTRADTIVISREIKENKILVTILFPVIRQGVGVIEFPSFFERLSGKIPLSLIGEVWFLENLIGVKKQIWEFFKRTLDILLALAFLIPLGFFMPLAALAIKLDSRGPVFFRQRRVGRNGQLFSLVKFRSMMENAQELGGLKGTNDSDPRVTRVGAFLRRSYLDELPQVINILKGEMSFVGPRPERPEYVAELKQKIPFYEMRLLTLPGLTGWAQIHMENDASVEDASEKMQYDLYYIKNRAFVLDLLIILKTILTVLQRQGR